jgi:hypothetical protein
LQGTSLRVEANDETWRRVLIGLDRSVDLALEAFSNGRERYLDEWKALLAAADERFVLHKVFVPKDSLLGVIEVHWKA